MCLNYNRRWSTINIEEWRGEKGTRRPGPEGQVLHHALRDFLQSILSRVLNVLAAATAVVVVVGGVREAGPVCRRRRAPMAAYARTRGSTRRARVNPFTAAER